MKYFQRVYPVEFEFYSRGFTQWNNFCFAKIASHFTGKKSLTGGGNPVR